MKSPFGLLQNPNEPPLQHEKEQGVTEVDSYEPPLQHEAKTETRDGAVKAKEEERLQHLNHDFSKEQLKRLKRTICATVMAKKKRGKEER